MNILYVWDADYPWDVRVEKICESLASAGHNVHIVARNLQRRPERESLGPITVHRLRAASSSKLNYVVSFPAFFNPHWRRKVDEVVRSESIDLIIVRDLPLAITAVGAGKRHGIPVLFDMAEDYVAMLWNVWLHRRIRLHNFLVRNPYFARAVERFAVPRVAHTMVVVEEARAVVLRAGGPDAAARTTIVSNTPRLEELTGIVPIDDDITRKMRGTFSIAYAGGIRLERGLLLTLHAVKILAAQKVNVLFVAIGNGNALDQLREETVRLGLEDHVLWLGWIDHREMLAYVSAAKVGLIPNRVSAHTNATIPNKIFDYMALALPVVASDAIPLKRIIEETGCGRTFRDGDAADLAAALNEVRQNPGEMGENGARAVRMTYNWSADEARLLALVERLKR